MAALVGRRTRTLQPQQAPQIDWDDPITAGLVFAYVCGVEAMGFGEDGRNLVPYQTSGGTVVGQRINTLTGTAAQGLSGSSYILAPTQTSVKSGVYSLFVFGTGPATGTQSAIDDDDGTARRFQFRLNAAKAEFIPFYSGGNGSVAAPTALSSNDLASGFAMGAVVNGTAYAVYQKGVKTAGTTLAGTAQAPNTSIWVGARKTGSTQGWLNGGLQVVAMWNRALTDAEMRDLAENPYRLFKGAPRRLWVPRLLASAYVLLATAGSFLATASQAMLTAFRRLVAATGSLTSDSAPASLVVSRRLGGSQGSFTMAGGAAAILAARKFVAGAGAFGVQASATPVVASRRLMTQPAAFTLSPGGIQMVYTPVQGPGVPTYVLGGTAGSFGMTGSAAQMRFYRRLQATSSAFVLAGAAAKVQAARRLAADNVGFAIAGSAVVLRYSGGGGLIDISTVPPARIVVFEGSGSRVVPFDGSGSRIVPFDGSGSRVVVFEGSGSKTVRFQ